MKIVFLSDIHLGASYIPDARKHEKAVCRFLSEYCSDADRLYLLGDILDYWFEYKNVVPRGFVRFFGELARLTDRGVKVTWLTGNHDIWLFDYLRDELGIEVVDKPYVHEEIAGKSFLLCHGDRLGNESKGFKLISTLFRSKVCQALYAAIHPRWTVPFAHRWSSSSRYSHSITDADENRHKDIIMQDARKLLSIYPHTDFIIMGHHHLMMDEKIKDSDCRVIVLGDWIELFSYAIFDGTDLLLKSL